MILAAAAELFSTVGYAATTTRQLARAAGLRQASLFHYIDRKEDLLAELLDRTVQPALSFLTQLDACGEADDVKLFVLARRDVHNLCNGPANLGALQLLPEARPPAFADFWAKRARLRRGYLSLVRAGARSGCFIDESPTLLTDQVFGLVESTIVWAAGAARPKPRVVATAVARSALRIVLVDIGRLDEVELAAGTLGVEQIRRTSPAGSATMRR